MLKLKAHCVLYRDAGGRLNIGASAPDPLCGLWSPCDSTERIGLTGTQRAVVAFIAVNTSAATIVQTRRVGVNRTTCSWSITVEPDVNYKPQLYFTAVQHVYSMRRVVNRQ